MGLTTGVALLPCVAAQTSVILHETFDSPVGFNVSNLLGPVAFFDDGGSEYFGISNGNGASYFSCPVPVTFPTYGASYCPAPYPGTDNVPTNAPTYAGFTGGHLIASRVHGAGAGWFSASPFILTWSAAGSCPGTLVFSGKFAEAGNQQLEPDDFVRVQASVDGAAPTTVLEFRGGAPSRRFSVDTDMDGIGDGASLASTAATFTANIPGMMTSSVVLLVALRSTSNNEDVALDDIQVVCGPTIVSPPPPPSLPGADRHACFARSAPTRAPRTTHRARAQADTVPPSQRGVALPRDLRHAC